MNVAVLGGGALGSVVVSLLDNHSISPRIYDVKGSDFASASECVSGCDLIFICVPSFAVSDVVSDCVSGLSPDAILINCAKGLHTDLSFLTDVIKDICPSQIVAELSGPAIAREIREGIHTKVDVVVDSDIAFGHISSALNCSYFTCVRSYDMHSVELGGIMKNVYALICGIIDGYHGGVNTKSFLMTEGLYEMTLLGDILGCSRDSFYGLSGLGDLLTTCMSKDSRNRRFGEYLASGKTVDDAMDELGMVAEGYYSTKTIKELADREAVSLPLLNALYQYLYEDLPLEDFISLITSDSIMVVS